MDTSSNINNILNKSFSLPNITDHEVDNYTLIRTSYTQEIFHGKQFKRMIKYLSCEEISLPGTMRNKVEVVIDKSCIEIPSRASIPEVSSNNIEKSLKIEPKRIRNIENPLPENPVKNKHINENSYYRYLNIFIISLIFVVIGRYIHISISTEPIMFNELHHELSTKILNQDFAVKTLIGNLKELKKPDSKKLITCLIGSTGVGKSYAINIIKKHVDSRVVHMFLRYDLPNLMNEDGDIIWNIRRKIYFSDYSIIVLDDLIMTDLEKTVELIGKFQELEGTNILIIIVFNIQTTDDNVNFSIEYDVSDIIRKKFELLSQNMHFAIFNELNETIAQIWLKNELINSNIRDNLHEKIINDLLVGQDIKHHGLKGLHSKLLMELDKHT